jgi:hypothetical protein
LYGGAARKTWESFFNRNYTGGFEGKRAEQADDGKNDRLCHRQEIENADVAVTGGLHNSRHRMLRS